MTREEAIMELNRFSGTTRLRLSANFWEALDRAIKSLEQEHCEDAISRQAVLDMVTASNEKNYKLLEFIKALPSVTSAQKKSERAHWIDNHNGTISCSCCHTWFHKEDDRYSYMRYCPNCGAKLEVEE